MQWCFGVDHLHVKVLDQLAGGRLVLMANKVFTQFVRKIIADRRLLLATIGCRIQPRLERAQDGRGLAERGPCAAVQPGPSGRGDAGLLADVARFVEALERLVGLLRSQRLDGGERVWLRRGADDGVVLQRRGDAVAVEQGAEDVEVVLLLRGKAMLARDVLGVDVGGDVGVDHHRRGLREILATR